MDDFKLKGRRHINLFLKKYDEQARLWPKRGRHILAQYTEEYVVVYQAYRPEIVLSAAENQFLGGEFSFTRMSWIKPNFLWMMYRSGWGQKEGQEITLAIKLKKDYFEAILKNAVKSSFDSSRYETTEDWKMAVQSSDVRLQWDPDHDPHGIKQERRAIQLGLRGDALMPFKGEGIVKIEDISEFVAEQRKFVLDGKLGRVHMPCETVYTPVDKTSGINIGIDKL